MQPDKGLEAGLSVFRRAAGFAWWFATLPYQGWRLRRDTARLRREAAYLRADVALLKANIRRARND